MATSPAGTPRPSSGTGAFTPFRLISFFVLLALLVLTVVFFWTTRDAMTYFSYLRNGAVRSGTTTSLVDLGPWKTAEALAPLAVSEEENQIAHEAEHVADHEVDQAFAAALRQAILDEPHRKLSEEALALKQKVAELEKRQREDQAQVDKLSAAKADKGGDPGDLDVAKAQLGLDTDELEEAQSDFDRASGDDIGRIQDELNAHEDSMRKYDEEVAKGQTALISSAQYRTLAAQIHAWLDQRQRYKLIEQARSQALNEAQSITAQHRALEQRANSGPTSTASHNDYLESLQKSSALSEISSIDDDRIQTEQQLANMYAKWSAQVLLQHRILMHIILGSVLVIVLILIAMLVSDAIVRRMVARILHDRRQLRTLRSMVEVGVQVVGVALILLVIFGAPQQTPTILGLTTAALTIALQDYIVAFLGWFTLMGKNGIHMGDWVEINGVGGEVVEFKPMTTTLLETGGGLADQGHPTGRRITFMNGYAIRGKFFNFSTAGQWMWDEIKVSVPPGLDIHVAAQQIEKMATEETKESVRSAEREWRQSVREESLARFSAAPVVNLRPSGAGIDLQLRFVTAAEDRFELRNRLYQRVVDLLHDSTAQK